MADAGHSENETVYANKDLVRDHNKFQCLLCDLKFRLRKSARQHMEEYHNATFRDSLKTRQRRHREEMHLLNALYTPCGYRRNINPEAHSPPRHPKRRRLNMDNSIINTQDNEVDNNTSEEEVHDNYIPDVLPDGDAGNAHQNTNFDVRDESHPNADLAPYLDMPIYNLHYYNGIRRRDHLLAVLTFAERHKLSGAATNSLIDLIQLHCPPGTILDTDIRKIQDIMGYNQIELHQSYYCLKCKNEWDCHNNKCSAQSCSGKKSDYFLTADLIRQLKIVLTRKGNFGKIIETKSRPEQDFLSDVYDGKVYKCLQMPGNFLGDEGNTNITFTVFHDGVAIFRCSNVSIWALFLVINELPIKIRNDRSNMLLWGIYQGEHKPNCDQYFSKFVHDAKYLYNTGVDIYVDNETVTIKGLCIIYTQDLAGRAFMFCQKSHGAAGACITCDIKGERMDYGKGKSRHYDPLELNVKLRTIETLKQAAITGTEEKPTDGIFGKSPILEMPHFSPLFVVIDSLHCVDIGVIKKLWQGWFQKADCVAYIGKKISEADVRLKSIKPTKQLTRLPNGACLPDWKGSQSRAFILFYGLFTLEGLLSPEVYRHFALLVEAMYLLLCDKITQDMIGRAKQCITMFTVLYEKLYRSPDKIAPCTLNMHSLTHLPLCVENFGPLYGYSTYPMETLNGQIVRGLSAKNSVKQQIFWQNYTNKICASQMMHATGPLADFLEKNAHNASYKNGIETDNCVILGKPQCLKPNMKAYLRDKKGVTEFGHYKHVQKIIHRGTYYDSKCCTRVKRRISYFVYLKEGICDFHILMIESYIYDARANKVFAYGDSYREKDFMVPGIAPNCKTMERYKEEKSVVAVEKFDLPVVYMKRGRREYFARFPNTIMSD